MRPQPHQPYSPNIICTFILKTFSRKNLFYFIFLVLHFLRKLEIQITQKVTCLKKNTMKHEFMVEIETLFGWSVVPTHKSLAEFICPLLRHMTWAHVGAGRPGLDPGVGGAGGQVCQSRRPRPRRRGSGEQRGRRGQPRMPPTPTHRTPAKGRHGAEVAKWSGAGHGDREIRKWICVKYILCYSVSDLVYISHVRGSR